MTARSLVAAAVLIAVIGCTPVQPTPETVGATPDSVSYQSLVAHLRTSGLRVEAAGEIEQPFFTPKAQVIRIGDLGEAQVYEYASEGQAAAEAARVHADGSIGASMPMWIAPPHFFRKGSLIVLYLGTDERTLQVLDGLLGSQFAGS